MGAAIQVFLTMLAAIVPSITTSAAIQNIIDALIKIIPLLEQFAPELIADVQIIAGILQSNPAATPEQVAALQAMSQQSDANFDSAATQAEQNDAAASGTTAAPATGTTEPTEPQS